MAIMMQMDAFMYKMDVKTFCSSFSFALTLVVEILNLRVFVSFTFNLVYFVGSEP
jgi:hypothetical protein